MVSWKRRTEDPADCESRACADLTDLFRKDRAPAAKNKKEAEESAAAGKNKGGASGGELDGEQVEAAAAAAATAAEVLAGNDGCPLDKGELGAATWGLIHTTAAHYPDIPSEETQNHARALMTSLAALYPCTYCRKDFKEEIRKQPPDVGSRLALSLWACQQHNLVNEKIGKPTFACTLPALDERWKTGKKSCWEG
eukprot:g6091.t1